MEQGFWIASMLEAMVKRQDRVIVAARFGGVGVRITGRLDLFGKTFRIFGDGFHLHFEAKDVLNIERTVVWIGDWDA